MIQELRRVLAKVMARNRTIPWYSLMRALGLVPRRYNVAFATAWLSYLINIVNKGKDVSNELRTEEWKKAMREGVSAVAALVKDSLGVSDQAIADDFTQRIGELPLVRQIRLAKAVLSPDEFAELVLSPSKIAEIGLSPDEIAEIGLTPDELAKIGLSPDKE